jgi:hypothetical protein
MIIVLAITTTCVAAALFLGSEVMAFIAYLSPWSGVILLAEFKYLGPRRLALEAIHNSLAAGRCPACLYPLTELPLARDGCVICSECGAAWRLGEAPHAPPTVP